MKNIWYQKDIGKSEDEVCVIVDSGVYESGWRQRELEKMVFGTADNRGYSAPTKDNIDYLVLFGISREGRLGKATFTAEEIVNLYKTYKKEN